MFLQIGDVAVNMDNVTRVEFRTEIPTVLISVFVYVGRNEYVYFGGNDADRFKAWWDKEAEVYRA